MSVGVVGARVGLAVLMCLSVASADELVPGWVNRILPRDAQVIESAEVDAGHGLRRMLVLWMVAPKKVVWENEGCAESVYGEHWKGPTRLSLFDLNKNRLINTVEIRSEGGIPDEEGGDRDFFRAPIRGSSMCYRAKAAGSAKAQVKLLHLRDLTGEGVKGQFALFDYSGSCGWCMGSVFGYSPFSDSAVQYDLESSNDGKTWEQRRWGVGLFDREQVRSGEWDFHYEFDHGATGRVHVVAWFDRERQELLQRTNAPEDPVIPGWMREALPADARVIETAAVTLGNGVLRQLVLWMVNPVRVVQTEPMGCVDWVYRDHWKGLARVSLFDLNRLALVNTVEIKFEYPASLEVDFFHVPFRVDRDTYYHVEGAGDTETVRILHLRDLTGEGIAGQFVVYEYSACGIAGGSAFGYSRMHDRVVQYEVDSSSDGVEWHRSYWMAQILHRTPIRPGEWDFKWWPGHGFDAYLHERVRFDATRQLFVRRSKVE